MNNLSPYIPLVGLLLSMLLLGSCGGTQKTVALNPTELMQRGEYERARKLVKTNGGKAPMDRAVVALSYLAESPNSKSANLAVQILNHGSSNISSAVAANYMLELTDKLPPINNNNFSLLVVESALGAAGYGPYTKSRFKPESASEIAVLIAVGALDRLSAYMSLIDEPAKGSRILEVWNACYSLLGGSLAVNNDIRAWRLFTSIAKIAIVFSNSSPFNDLSKVLFLSTVLSIEQNPEISFAAKCDLSSPFDQLKPAMLRHRKLLGRLEHAVSGAIGCTLGTYAPKP